MNTLTKIVSLASLCLMITSVAIAQTTGVKHPQSAKEIQRNWFSVNEEEMHYQFTVELDKGEFMVLKFKKLSDWTSTGDFMKAFSAADRVVKVYKDSLLQEQNTQVLDVYIPVNQKNIVSRFNQFNESGNMMTLNEDGASALKLGMDTLRITQAKPDSVKIQYTFVLKRLANYNSYEQDENWKVKAGNMIDSAVNEYRSKWKHPNAKSHALIVTLNPVKNTRTVDRSWKLNNDFLVVEAGIGVSLVRNTLCPNGEWGIGVYISHDNLTNTFARFSFYGFSRFVETSPDKYKAYGTSFINLELGTESNHKNPNSMFYKTSLGFGYKLLNKKEEDRDPTMDKQMYRIFFNYSINKFIVVTPEFITNFRKGDRKNAWGGVSVNLRLF